MGITIFDKIGILEYNKDNSSSNCFQFRVLNLLTTESQHDFDVIDRQESSNIAKKLKELSLC